MRTVAAFSLLIAAAGLASSQSIDPNSVPEGTRMQWCNAQVTQCPLICLQVPGASAAASNLCDVDTLQYSCVCNNGLTPNASEYTQTIPYFICTESNNQCVAACPNGNSACATNCRSGPGRLCGAQDPKRVNTSTITTSTMSATATLGGAMTTDASGATIYSGLGGASAPTETGNSSPLGGSGGASPTGKSAAVALELGASYGLAVVVGGVLAGFGLVL